jgi:hypothetical protein
MRVCDCEQRLQDIKACHANPKVFTSNKVLWNQTSIIMPALSKFFTPAVIMALLGMTLSFLATHEALC